MSGWWWGNDIKTYGVDTGTRYGLEFQPNTVGNPGSLYGVVSTFRANGTAVWYIINATFTDGGNYQGTASEFTGGGTLSGTTPKVDRLQTIVANVKLMFSMAGNSGIGTLTWTPRDGTPAVVKTLTRYPLGTTAQKPTRLRAGHRLVCSGDKPGA